MNYTDLFDRALTGTQSTMIYGAGLPLARLTARVRSKLGTVPVLDLRTGARLEVEPKRGAVVVWLGAVLEPSSRAVLLELLETEEVRVIALSVGASVAPELAQRFGASMSANVALRAPRTEAR